MNKMELRKDFFNLHKESLEQIASRAMKRGLSPSKFFVICIDVDDPAWKDLVDILMPNHNWQALRDRGIKPVLRGYQTNPDLVEYLCKVVPDIAPAFATEPPPGFVRAFTLTGGGASFSLIEPKPQYQYN